MERSMGWTKPKVVEFCVGMEINCYACAELQEFRSPATCELGHFASIPLTRNRRPVSFVSILT